MKWAVYSEEKPQRIGSYLVTHITDSGRCYVDYDYWTVCDKFKYHPTDVVACMPFPEPYGEREGEVIESKGCVTCKHTDKEWYEEPCEDCHGNSGYERKEGER